MKEIKFRAYDDVLGMCDVLFIDFEAGSVNVAPVKTQVHPAGIMMPTSYGLFIENANLMQYTGLKDKNGKEIYEGDILDYKTNYEPYKCVIKWRDDLGSCGCCYDACSSVGFVGEILPGTKYDYSDLASSYEKMEIIGNIYEIPELLEKK